LSRQIIQQPNGRFALWSTNSDAITVVDASEEEVIEYFGQQAYDLAAEDVRRIIQELRKGERPYYQFTMTWDKAIKEHEERHGPFSRTTFR
jgi:hypothetical protein